MTKPLDITGKRFGRLTAQNPVPHRKGLTRWKCACDCGGITEVDTGALVHGNTTSCGCLKSEIAKQRALDLTGQRFGRLVLIKRGSNTALDQSRWLCRCDCGIETEILTMLLRNGKTASCGCLRRELGIKLGAASLTHGQSSHRRGKRHLGTSEYNTWSSMISRCHNPATDAYRHYGAKGRTVCDRWRSSFEAFRDDMGPKPTPKHTLDRVDNDLGYSPENCRWATYKQQANNQSNNRRITIGAETKTMTQWCESYGIRVGTFYQRLRRGMTEEQAITTPREAPGRKPRPRL